MAKVKPNTVDGVVVEAHPNTLFSITLDDGTLLKANMSGRMRKFRIYVVVGDKVQVQLDEYGDSHKIIRRH